MERIELRGLEVALGITNPWTIKAARVNHQEKVFDVHLELNDRKRLFGIFEAGKKAEGDELLQGSWQYMMVGGYRCVIHGQIPNSGDHDSAGLSYFLLAQAAFLGNPHRNYSNYLRQQVALAQIKGLDNDLIAQLLQLSPQTISKISDDLDKASTQLRSLAYLPTEVDGIWERVLREQCHIQTNTLSMKFLLSKLQRSTSGLKDPVELQPLVEELRKFFMANASLLDKEIDQLCGITSKSMIQRANTAKSKQKLVLPSLRSPVWLELLSGKIKLNSQSVPLNLLISRQRNAFINGVSTQDKMDVIESLRQYFRLNCRTLKPELVLLNRAMQIREQSTQQLPGPEHSVWQKILQDDTFIPSNHVAYKLLLAKLRAQVARETDPTIKRDAAARIREFIKQNHKSMRQELVMLFKQSAAV